MESTNEDNQVIINDYTGDPSPEDCPADGSTMGSFSFPFHSLEGIGSSSVDEPDNMSHAIDSNTVLSWTRYLVQQVSGGKGSQVSTNFDFFATDTRPMDLQNPFKGLEVDKVGHVLFNLAVQIYGFVNCKDRGFSQIVASINGILMALRLDTRVYDWVANEIWSLVTGFEVKPQSLEDLGEALGKDAVKFVSTNLTSIVERVVKFCSAAFIAPSLLQSKTHYLRNIGSVLEKTRLTSFTSATLTVESIVSMLAHCVTRAVEYLVNWSFPDEVTVLLRESTALRETVEATLSVMDRDTKDEMLISLSSMQARLTDKHLSMRVERFTVAQALLRELDTVSRLITRVRNHAIHVTRVQAPLTFMAVGEPAIGKSEWSKTMMYLVASVKRPGPDSMPYKSHEIVTAPSSKYWNNMTNDSRVVIFDDVGVLVKPGETSQYVAARWSEGIIQLTNNQPFTPELAQAELKGTVQPRLDLVLCTANEENRFGDAASVNAPEAVFRRYDMIDVGLKPEFRGPNGHIDFNLVKQAGDDIYTVNPWTMRLRRYNLAKAREIARHSPAKAGLNPALWEHIEFTYQGQKRLSDDITFDMLREICVQKCAVQSSGSDAITDMDARLRRRLFPNLPESAVLAQAGPSRSDGDWYLYQCHHVAMNCRFSVQTLMLFIMPLMSLIWVAYKAITWKVPGWLRMINNKRSFGDHCRYCVMCCFMQYQLLLLCWGFTAARFAGPLTRCIARTFGLDLRAIFLSLLLGRCVGGLFSSLPTAQLSVLSTHVRRRYVKFVDSLAGEERRARLQRVLIRGVFTGFTLNALLRCAKFYLEFRRVGKLAAAFNKRVGLNPFSEPQTTMDSDGNIKVEMDPKIDAKPRQETFKGTYHTMIQERLRKANPVQTVDDSRQFVGRCMHRITIVPCTGSQLGTAVRSKYRNVMHACAYDTYGSGTYVITAGHAFARDYPHFAVRIHDASRRTKEHIVCKDDIVFAPKMVVGRSQHDLDLCMFEIPRRVTGSLPVIKAMLSDEKPRPGEVLTRLVPGHDEAGNVNSIDFESGDFQAVNSHVYASGTPASQMFQSPLSYWITGIGDEGMCGALVMSGGIVVAMHTGGHPTSETITACPLTQSMLSTMKATMVGRSLGGVSNARLDEYVIREPYLEEYSQSKLEITPNVSVRTPGALSPALDDCQFDFVGTLQREGVAVNVKAKSSIDISKHVDVLIDYLPNVPGLISGYGIPAKGHKMRDTVGAFIDKVRIPRPGDAHLLELAKQKVGMALYSACHGVICKEPGFAAMKVLNIQGGLDGKGFNMAGKIPLKTSAGIAFPGVKLDYLTNAYSAEHDEYLVCFHEDDEISMEIRDSVFDIIERRARGEVGLVVNFMCPKDEVLQIKQNGLTKPPRHINKTDIAHTIAMRMYFQPLLIVLGYDPLSCGHSVGLDPTVNYLETMKSLINGDIDTPLYESDVQKSSFIATDYSGFDLSLSGEVLAAVMDIFINLTHLLDYTDEDRKVMTSMAYDIINPSVVMLGTVVNIAGVNTSGNPLTTMINCVANMMINCQIATMVKHDVLRGKYMEDYPREYSRLTLDDVDFDPRRIVTYGDDVVIRVERNSKLTQPAVIYYGKQLGFQLTAADKSDVVTTYAQDFGFLKRKFNLYVERDSREIVMCLAPLAMDSIFKPFVWGEWNKVDINDHYAGLVKSALHELVQHGEKVYNTHAPNLWNFVEAFSVETKPRKNASLVFRSRLKSRFRKPFLSWEESIREKYGPSLIRTKGELSPSDLELIEL